MKKLFIIISLIFVSIVTFSQAYKDMRGPIRMLYNGDTLIMSFAQDSNYFYANNEIFNFLGTLKADKLTIGNFQIDSIYSLFDTLFFVTDSGTFKMGREIGGSATIITKDGLEYVDDTLRFKQSNLGTAVLNPFYKVTDSSEFDYIEFIPGKFSLNIEKRSQYGGKAFIILDTLSSNFPRIFIGATGNDNNNVYRPLIIDSAGVKYLTNPILDSDSNMLIIPRSMVIDLIDSLGGGLDSLEVQAQIDTTLSNFNPLNNIQLGYGLYDDGDTLYTDTTLLATIDTVANMIHDSLEAATDIRDYLGYGLTSDVMITVDTTVIATIDNVISLIGENNDTTITLLDNTTGGNINIGQVGYCYEWTYKITRGANWRRGNLSASGYSTTPSYDKGWYTESANIGVTINSFNISGGQIRINYTTTNTGSNATMVLHLISKI